MKTFPLPAVVAALVGLIAVPFSAAAAGTLLFTAALGSIIHADYVQRQRRIRLPLRAVTKPMGSRSRAPFQPEVHPLAA